MASWWGIKGFLVTGPLWSFWSRWCHPTRRWWCWPELGVTVLTLGCTCDYFSATYRRRIKGFCRSTPSEPNRVGGVPPLATNGDDRKSVDDREFDQRMRGFPTSNWVDPKLQRPIPSDVWFFCGGVRYQFKNKLLAGLNLNLMQNTYWWPFF